VPSYSNATITMTDGASAATAGGALGRLNPSGSVRRVYSAGAINNISGQTKNAGGFVGRLQNTGTLFDSFSTSIVSATNSAGGFYTETNRTISNFFWYKPVGNTQNCIYSGTITGCSTNANLSYFQNSSNAPLSSWDFTNIWRIPSGGGLPILSWQHDTP